MMNYSNVLGLPRHIVEVLTRQRYQNNHDGLSVTRLIDHPHKIYLENKHDDQITVDVKDMMWSVLGSIGHGIIEGTDSVVTEFRVHCNEFAIPINGKIDAYDPITRTLFDNKFTSQYTLIYNKFGKPEWIMQLNIYAYMLRTVLGWPVEKIQVVAFLRDMLSHDKNKAGRPDDDIQIVNLPVWPDDFCREFIRKRVELHQNYNPASGEYCDSDSRWKKATVYARIKEGGQRAIKLYDNLRDAHSDLKEGETIDVREGTDVRCAKYCPANRFCHYGKKYVPLYPMV